VLYHVYHVYGATAEGDLDSNLYDARMSSSFLVPILDLLLEWDQ